MSWGVILASLAAVAATPAVAQDVYILAGQSNMSGRGALAELTEDERAADPAIQLYGNDGQWRPARDPLDDATGQVDAVSADTKAAVGPGLFFARSLRARSRRPIVLVPCAKGGSTLAQWLPASVGRDTLYGSCLARARAAGGRIAGILWYQGESDTRDAAVARGWAIGFGTLVSAFRRDLAAPRLPVVFVRIADAPAGAGDAERYPAWRLVQSIQSRVRIDCTAMVRTDGLPRLPDDLHLTTPAQRTLGPRVADAMRVLQRRCR
ncbi:hypothetical protein ASE86_13565 [Sphingomonas sp. Leaf33]|uniref:sialate O-acetylesterase n=1 Tax=Sphingomonas sp. Leaf33 TaxID=1736215 RepID=UPI0006FF08C9|nr:sialate O-acetylesterase [Sphingomonas sp. Leaf33]KQN19487.1 hypothetical protein ASE86_13565 [Sphingomonas sp. Leaf33]